MEPSEVMSILEEAKLCFSCGKTEDDWLPEQLIAFGYLRAIEDFGIWKDGTQTIGCMQKSVKEIKQKIKQRFEL